VIVPIFKTQEDLDEIKKYIQPIVDSMEETHLNFEGKYIKESMKLRYKIDEDSHKSPGWKFNEYEMK
jgi:hypothetical protein